MIYNTLKEVPMSLDVVDVFYGYNRVNPSKNEFKDTKNLTSDLFPRLAVRKPRGTYAYPSQTTHHPNALATKDALCYVDGNKLYINNAEVMTLTAGQDVPRQLISMGAYLIIMPDKLYYNTQDSSDKGNIEVFFNSTGTNVDVTITPCTLEGEAISPIISSSEPTNISAGTYWLDTGSSPHQLKKYTTLNTWVDIATSYIKITLINTSLTFDAFKENDGVEISGIPSAVFPSLADLNGTTSIIQSVSEYSIVVIGQLEESVATETPMPLKLSRVMPKMDFIIESGNRLWGCRYGTNNKNEIVNEIYASKLGDFKNWYCFEGISTDSYIASCGTDGFFTGAITYLGYPTFFKENFLHKVYGQFPDNFQIQTTAVRGVQKGAGDSLAIVREKLFYKSITGVMVYDGSLPVEVSNNFGDDKFNGVDTDMQASYPLRCGAVAGALGSKYYVSMKSDQDQKWYLFVYDSYKGIWLKEEELRCKAFTEKDNKLYYINNSNIKTTVGSDVETIAWSAETGYLIPTTTQNKRTQTSPYREYVTRINVRLQLYTNSQVTFYAEYDSSGTWVSLGTFTGNSLGSINCILRLRRSDHTRLKIVGSGDCQIYSIAKTIEKGSEM